MKATYAQALERAVASGVSEEVAVTNLIAHLKARGRMKLLPGILSALKTRMHLHKVQGTHLEVAHKEEVAAATRDAGLTDATVSVNPSLIRGWRARAGGTLVDKSAKRALIDLYRSFTH